LAVGLWLRRTKRLVGEIDAEAPYAESGEAVRDKTPWQVKLECGSWTLALIGKVIYRQFGKHLTKPRVARIMGILGFTPAEAVILCLAAGSGAGRKV